MTVVTETNRSGPYIGNGVTTAFSYGFRIVSASHLLVISTNDDGDTPLTLNAHYSVNGVGNVGGGSITMATPPADGVRITILRNVPFTQDTDLENHGAYYAETVERAFDLAAMRDQQLSEQIGRSVKFSPSDTDTDLTFPPAAERAGGVLGFDDFGRPVAAHVAPDALLLASKSEAETGINNAKLMTPLRTKQAIVALSPRVTRIVARAGTPFAAGADYIASGISDHIVVQTAASELHAAGGGVLFIAPGSYDLGTAGINLSGLDSVAVQGGGGKTTRLIKKAGFTGTAGLFLSACSNCSVRGVYVDSNGQDGNGIAAGPQNIAAASGTRSRNITIEDNYIELQPTDHNYGIFMLDVQTGRVAGNFVDGMTTSFAVLGEQEGIECFGGKNIKVYGNHVTRISGNAFSIVNFPIYATPSLNIHVHHNTAESCGGLNWINAAQGSGATNHMENVAFEDNEARLIYSRGIFVAINSGDISDTGLRVHGLSIRRNKVRFALIAEGAVLGTYAPFSIGAALNNGGVPDTSKFSMSAIVHEDNVYFNCLDNVAGAFANYTYVNDVKDRRNKFQRQAVNSASTIGAFISNSSSVWLQDNEYVGCRTFAIYAVGFLSFCKIERNTIFDWDFGNGGVAPIVIDTGSSSSALVIRDNAAWKSASMTSSHLVVVGSAANHIASEISGNRYAGSFAGQAEVNFSGTPGADGNRGEVIAGAGAAFTVATKRCRPDSAVLVQQETGTGQAIIKVQPIAGSFTVTLAAPTSGSVFRWRII